MRKLLTQLGDANVRLCIVASVLISFLIYPPGYGVSRNPVPRKSFNQELSKELQETIVKDSLIKEIGYANEELRVAEKALKNQQLQIETLNNVSK